LLGLVLLLCTVAVAACGGSSASSSTSASVASSAKPTGSGSTATTGAGATTGTTSTGASSSTKARHIKRRHAARRATASSPSPKRRRQASTLRVCLEKNGIKPRTSGSRGATRAQLQAALARCDTALVPKRSPQAQARTRRALLAKPGYRQALARFTACMRQHGVPNFPEANTSGNGPLYPARSVKPSPQVRAAQKACIGQLATR
jgi:hypothetical protein